jgi:ribosomal protein S21
MEVFVRNNDVNAALRALKKKMQREGTFREMKLRRYYEKPSATIVLKLTCAPSDTSVKQTPQTAGPLLRGTGDTDYLCGNCGFVIASGMGQGQRVAVDRATCSACGAENEFPPELRS